MQMLKGHRPTLCPFYFFLFLFESPKDRFPCLSIPLFDYYDCLHQSPFELPKERQRVVACPRDVCFYDDRYLTN